MVAVCPQANCRLHFDRREVSALGTQFRVSIWEDEYSSGTFPIAMVGVRGEGMEDVP